MSLIVAIEPDARQAAQLKALVRHRVGADLVHAETTEQALTELAKIGDRVPDLVLVPSLLSPQEDAALAGALRIIATVANVPMLTIPVLADPEQPPGHRNLFARWRSRTVKRPGACDPGVFADQISEYLREVANERRARLADAASELEAVAPETPPTEPVDIPADTVVDTPARFTDTPSLFTDTPSLLADAPALFNDTSDTFVDEIPALLVDQIPEIFVEGAPETLASEASAIVVDEPPVVEPEPLPDPTPVFELQPPFDRDDDQETTPQFELVAQYQSDLEAVQPLEFEFDEPARVAQPELDFVTDPFELEPTPDHDADLDVTPDLELVAESQSALEAPVELPFEFDEPARIAQPQLDLVAEEIVPIDEVTIDDAALDEATVEALIAPLLRDLEASYASESEPQPAPELVAAIPEPEPEPVATAIAQPDPEPEPEPEPVLAAAAQNVVAEPDLDPLFFVEEIQSPPKRDESAWMELIASLRQDIERLKHEKTDPAGAAAAVVAKRPAAPARPARKSRPTQDQWGLFDPDQCGFGALLAKLDEINAREEVGA